MRRVGRIGAGAPSAVGLALTAILAASAQIALGTFGAPISVDLGTTAPADRLVIDLDQDGHLDLIVTGRPGNVITLRGNGAGSLANVRALAFPDAAGVSAADFNGDGVLDLAVTQGLTTKSYNDPLCGSTIVVGIFLGPGMSLRSCLFAGGYPIAVQAGNFDGDRHMDLAVVSKIGHGLRIFKGVGDGTFVQTAIVPGSAVSATRMLPPTDLNGDGLLDLLVAHEAGVMAFLGGGDATFASAGSAGGSARTPAAAAGDFNRDQVTDIASIESATGRLLVALGTGNGTFSTRIVSTMGAGLTDVAVTEINNDGNADIVVADNGAKAIRIFLGSGNGTFVAHPPLTVSQSPNLLAVQDWDEDGDRDLGIIDASVGGLNALAWIARQDGGGASDVIPPAVTLISPAEGATVSGTVAIRAAASDNVGVTHVEALAGGAVAGRSAGPDYIINWNTAALPNGPVTLAVRAFDAALNESNWARVQVLIDNPDLPETWSGSSIGAVAVAGAAAYDPTTGVFTVQASGADIWGTADEFHYASTPISGDFEITARVISVENVNQWTKAGLMIRESVTDRARHASIFATPTALRGVVFQRRQTVGAASVHTQGPLLAAPVWLKLTRVGNVIISYYRKATTDPWTQIGSQALTSLSSEVLVGLAVTSHMDGILAAAKFDHVTLARPEFFSADIGSVGLTGATSGDGTTLTLEGSGSDIWATADAFRFAYRRWSGDGTITARVRSVEFTNVWAKAGVMFRETLTAPSKHVMAVVTPARGAALQYRAATAAISSSSIPVAAVAPQWLRLSRTGNTFTGAVSSDGVVWTVLDTVTVPMLSDIFVGLPVTSHNNSLRASAVFEQVSVR